MRLATTIVLLAAAAPAAAEPGALDPAAPATSMELGIGVAAVDSRADEPTFTAFRFALDYALTPSIGIEASLAVATWGTPDGDNGDYGPLVYIEMWDAVPPSVGMVWGRRLGPELEAFARARYAPRTRTRTDPQGGHSGDYAAAVYLHDAGFAWSQAHTLTGLGGARWQRDRWTVQGDLGVASYLGIDAGGIQTVLRASLGGAVSHRQWSASAEVVLLSDALDEGVVDDYDLAAGFALGVRRELGPRWYAVGTLSTTAVDRGDDQGDDGLAVLLGVGHPFGAR